MARVTILIGLCGSGKSYTADEICRHTGALFFDEPIGRKSEAEIAQRLREGRDCVVEEAFYCIRNHRDGFLAVLSSVPDVEIRFVVFADDIESANWNVQRRTNKARVPEHMAINAHLKAHFSFPDACEIRSIHRIE